MKQNNKNSAYVVEGVVEKVLYWGSVPVLSMGVPFHVMPV